MSDEKTIIIDSFSHTWNHDMTRDTFIANIIEYEASPKRAKHGSLSFRTERSPERRMLYFYEACLWGAWFEVPSELDRTGWPEGWNPQPGSLELMANTAHPRVEFINVGKYSSSTSSNQSKVLTAVLHAHRRYTPCLVIDPMDTGGKHWSPPDDWSAMLVAADWARENGALSGWNKKGNWVEPARVRAPLELARTLYADNFWLFHSEPTRTP